mmetsp:Transcript_11045/g.30897  ORF Transcript_11045/g.30897 Transcript_11045/m.30897 type:complete len:322 (-) Transcript_11045:336-1301(-)
MYLPGASAVPANMDPHITVLAPRAKALVMCPLFWIPPSAMTGTPCSAASLLVWYTAVAWPLPTAQTSWVVQMDPLPIPTRRPSAPTPMSLSACLEVTTLPAMTCKSGKLFLMYFIISIWYTESPWLESRITASTPSFTRASSLTLSFSLVPTAQPMQSLPSLFTVAVPMGVGYLKSWSFSSPRSTTPTRAPSSPTTGRRPFLLDASLALTASSPSVAETVTRSPAFVMTSPSFTSAVLFPASMSTSLVVTRPRSFPPSSPVSVTSTVGYFPAERPRPSHSSSTCPSVASAESTRGSKADPVQGTYRFACLTIAACSSTVQL